MSDFEFDVEALHRSIFSGPMTDDDGEPIVVGGETLMWEEYLATLALGYFFALARMTPLQREITHRMEQAHQDLLLYGATYYNASTGERIDPREIHFPTQSDDRPEV